MIHIQPLDRFEHPLLAPYRTMKAQQDHNQQGIFVAEGEKIARRLFETDFKIISAIMPSKWVETYRPIIESRTELVEVFVAEKSLLGQLTGFSMYQGVFAIAQIPPSADLDWLVANSPSPRFLAAVEGVSNAENMGSLTRNFAAFGAQALLQGETACSPYLRRAVRSSMGNVFRLPVVVCRRLVGALRRLRAQGIQIVSAHPRGDGRTLSQASLAGDCCVVFGSEGAGISPEILEVCDEAVAVPMAPGVDSLNVGSAAAVFCYEVARQQRRL